MLFEEFIIKVFKDKKSEEFLGTTSSQEFPTYEQIDAALDKFGGESATIDKQFVRDKLPFSE